MNCAIKYITLPAVIHLPPQPVILLNRKLPIEYFLIFPCPKPLALTVLLSNSINLTIVCL